MAKPSSIVSQILDSGLVAVIRSDQPDRLVDVAQALLAGGVHCLEITFTVPAAPRVLENVSDRLGDQIILGAGTVLDAETARIAMLSGARFIVSPSTHLDVIQMGRRYSVPVMAGAWTPTEVVTAWQAGADLIKLFPADVGGPGYLKTLKGPLPQIPLMPTGGIDLQNAGDYLKSGAVALGVGSSLVQPKAIQAGKMEELEALARQFVSVVQETRSSLANEA